MQANSIKNVAVLGLGTMGHGIAQTMSIAGCTVRGFDPSPDARSNLHDRIRANLNQMVAVGILDESIIDEVLGRITVCPTQAEALVGAEFVTEAIVEDLELKQRLFAQLESLVEDSTILASNTSSYPMTEISAEMSRPERAIVTHWFNPPHIVPVVEVVAGKSTSAATTQTAYDFLNRIGKTAVRVDQEIPGFLVNRVQNAMFREIWDLLDRGVASPEEIDRAIQGSMGLRLAAYGPLAIIDYAGWDVTSRVFLNVIPHMRNDYELPARISELVQDGHFGAKTGQGIFEYPAATVKQNIADRDQRYLELVKLQREDAARKRPTDSA